MQKIWMTVALLFAILAFLMPVSAEEWELVKLTDNNVDDRMSGGSMIADGKKIVFVSDMDGNKVTRWDREVFLMDLETMQVERVTHNVYEDALPTISGDGSKIAFVEYRSDWARTYVVSEEDGWQQTTPLFSKDQYIIPLLNHDGSILAVYIPDNHEIKYIHTSTGEGHWTIASLDDYIYSHFYPMKSAGGYYHAFAERLIKAVLDNDVSISNLEPSDPVRIYSSDEGEYLICPPHASDNGKVVFSMYSNHGEYGRLGIFIYQNGNVMQLVSGEEGVYYYPVISGDGNRVFYIKYSESSGLEVFAINSDGSGNERIASISLERMSIPLVNYDGSILVFTGKDEGGDFELYALMKKGVISLPATTSLSNLFPALPPLTTITVGSAEAPHGDEVQIPVEVANANNIGSMNLVIAYPDVLEVVEVIQGSLTENSLFDYNVEDGKIKIGVSDTSGISGDGSLFYIKFRVAEEPKETGEENSGKQRTLSERTLSEDILNLRDISNLYYLSVEEAEIYDVNGSQVNPIIINGTFQIISEDEANRGDVNGDGRINSLDALLALQMSIGKMEAKPVADMDGDGKVLAKDATEIMKISAENIIEQARKMIGEKFEVVK